VQVEQFGYNLLYNSYVHESNSAILYLTLDLDVDDFGVNYVGRLHAEHLVQTLKSLYTTIRRALMRYYSHLGIRCET
jgi:hypothetical protein